MTLLEPTGINVLDTILGGGLPRPSAVGLIGNMGSGKSLFAKQIAANMLRKDFRVLYYSIDESADDVKESLVSLGPGVEEALEEGKLALVDMFALGVERLAEVYPSEEPERVADIGFKFSDLIAQGRSFTLKHLGKKQLVVMDSITPFFLMEEPKKVFQFGQVLKYATRFAKAIGCATFHTNVLDETIQNALVSFADVVVEINKHSTETFARRGTLRVIKLGKLPLPPRAYYYELTPQGIMISTAPVI